MIKSGLHVLFLILEMFTFSALNTTSAVGFLVVTLHCEVKSLSGVRLFATPWTVAYQASPSMGFSRQDYWSGLPFPSPGDLPNPGIEPGSPALEAGTLTSEPPGKWTKFIDVIFEFMNNENKILLPKSPQTYFTLKKYI